ncbi:hypothetical protein [Hydrogenophaga sp.]|uniref:hypothetical protein n=1 Tax=Hydrogenophaga sp. TaxID=1904254 RepID=UPI003F71C55C
MQSVQRRNPNHEVAPVLQSDSPGTSGRWFTAAVLLSLAGFCAAQAVIRHAAVCSDRMGIVEGALMSLGAIVGGAAFNWVSIDVLLTEVWPTGGRPSLTLSSLLSVILMFGAIWMSSMALQVRRWNPASVGCVFVACALFSVYASSSALGICVISSRWLD